VPVISNLGCRQSADAAGTTCVDCKFGFTAVDLSGSKDEDQKKQGLDCQIQNPICDLKTNIQVKTIGVNNFVVSAKFS